MSKRLIAVASVLLGLAVATQTKAQDYSVLRINEVIAANSNQGPASITGRHADMIELYNPGDEALVLDAGDPEKILALGNSWDLDYDDETLGVWLFPQWPLTPSVIMIPPGGSIVVFCDKDLCLGSCELHASFEINNTGEEPITLWGPVVGLDKEGRPIREVIDRVWLPPLGEDVSFGRYPDGAGPAPVPLEEVFNTFVFNPPGTSTFGTCFVWQRACWLDGSSLERVCRGYENGPGGNLAPEISRLDHTTNAPAADEAVQFTLRIRDDKEPRPGNIARAELRYRVYRRPDSSAGETQVVPLVYDEETGVQEGSALVPPRPLDRWTLWKGTVPGQPAGTRVEFYFYVRDREGLESTAPHELCPDGIGPCDREFGGHVGDFPGCEKDDMDVTCMPEACDDDGDEDDEIAGEAIGERYNKCEAWLTYVVGYNVRPELAALVINEVVPLQGGLLHDPSEWGREDGFDDFLELYNGSAADIDLSELWLSERFFHPRVWQFPPGSRIAAGEYLIVWCDSDGSKCPDPFRADRPCFWKCPDPNNSSFQEYHTNFDISFENDQVFIYDSEDHGFGLIHGVEFGFDAEEILDKSYSLLPDGDRNGCFKVSESTPMDSNSGQSCASQPSFKRGDCNDDGNVDMSDAISILSWLFLGAGEPGCVAATNTNGDAGVDLSDSVYLLSHLFLGGPPPVAPFPECGPAAEDEELGCHVLPASCK